MRIATPSFVQTPHHPLVHDCNTLAPAKKKKREKSCRGFSQRLRSKFCVQDSEFADCVLDIFDNMRTEFPRASATAAAAATTGSREKLAKKMEQQRENKYKLGGDTCKTYERTSDDEHKSYFVPATEFLWFSC